MDSDGFEWVQISADGLISNWDKIAHPESCVPDVSSNYTENIFQNEDNHFERIFSCF